jgi:hypothetical protein
LHVSLLVCKSLSTRLIVFLSICFLSICLSVYLFVIQLFQYVYLSIYLFVRHLILFSFCLSTYLSISLSLCPTVCLFVCPSVHLSVCLFQKTIMYKSAIWRAKHLFFQPEVPFTGSFFYFHQILCSGFYSANEPCLVINIFLMRDKLDSFTP